MPAAVPTGTYAVTDAQLAGAAQSAGFTGDALVKAVATALAETRGHPTSNAHNPHPPDDSYGPWQINMFGPMGPARRKQFGLTSNTDLYNLDTNAKAAYAISSGGKNFTPWSTFTSGLYLAYMPRARTAAGNPDSTGSAPNAQQALNPLSIPGDISDFFKFITNTTTWLRLGMILAGVVLIVISLSQLSGYAGKIQDAAKTAAGLVPGGKAVTKAAAKAA